MRLQFGDASTPRKAAASGLLFIVAAVALAGCVETAGEIAPGAGSEQFVRRPDASMAGATMAIMSVEGAPAELTAEFNQSLNEAAVQRDRSRSRRRPRRVTSCAAI